MAENEVETIITDPFIVGMMNIAETLRATHDTADGMRAELVARGFSPEGAERVAVEFLTGLTAAIFRQVT